MMDRLTELENRVAALEAALNERDDLTERANALEDKPSRHDLLKARRPADGKGGIR